MKSFSEIQSSVRQSGFLVLWAKEFIQTSGRQFLRLCQHRKRWCWGKILPAHPTRTLDKGELYANRCAIAPRWFNISWFWDTDRRVTLGRSSLLTRCADVQLQCAIYKKAYFNVVVNQSNIYLWPDVYLSGLATDKKALIITPSAGNFVVGTLLDKMNFFVILICVYYWGLLELMT